MTRRWNHRPEGSNWGDFGDDDECGRLNLITPQRRRRAAEEIREGIAFPLSLPLDLPGGDALWEGRKPPRLGSSMVNQPLAAVQPEWTDIVSDDYVLLHTQYSTQWDSLAHVGQAFDADGDGVAEALYYNGYRAGTDVTAADPPDGVGARKLGMETMAATGVQGRAVLVDLHASFGPGRTRVGYDGLMRVIERSRAEIGTGDFLCLHTGFGDLLLEMAGHPVADRIAGAGALLDGNDPQLVDWVRDSGIVAICSDTPTVEWVDPTERRGHRHALLALHELCLFKLGIYLGEFWYFGAIARWLAEHDRSAFFLTAPPLCLRGAVGSPVTPVGTV